MYEYDAPAAERRAMALTIDRALLGQLLGEPALRELLDRDVIATVELELQRLADGTRTEGPDAIVDLLRELGPLDAAGVAARCRDPETVPSTLASLANDRRIVQVSIGGVSLWATVEDVSRLRDALGVQPPRGLPESLLESVADPLGDVVGRYARTHTPFSTARAASALGLPFAVVDTTLRALESRGRVSSGAFLPGEGGMEWVDAGVLRRIRRRSLAVLRSEVEAVEPSVLASFLPAWHDIGAGGTGIGRLLAALDRLQGVAVPASTLEADILASRMSYSPDLLDSLLASGDVVWIGRGSLAGSDGRVALYRRDQVSLLHWDADHDSPSGPIHDDLRAHLTHQGASFFSELYRAAGGGDPQLVVDAIWDLVWAGAVTNDTIAPLRAFLSGRSRKRTTGKPGRASSTPPAAAGRWSLVAAVLTPSSPTEQQAARAAQLLERHGVVVRDAVLGEGVPGGFAGLYPIYAAMEESGRVRRGYFIEGMGGAQFALPGAIDRLRTTAGATVTLAAADPANPYGAAAVWPDSVGRPSRAAGAYVVIVDGIAAAFVERGGRTILTFDQDTEPNALAHALADLARRRGRMTIERVDGVPVSESRLGRPLTDAGFSTGYKGVTLH
jgi:ATP-dependent Lhr-like helicase